MSNIYIYTKPGHVVYNSKQLYYDKTLKLQNERKEKILMQLKVEQDKHTNRLQLHDENIELYLQEKKEEKRIHQLKDKIVELSKRNDDYQAIYLPYRKIEDM